MTAANPTSPPDKFRRYRAAKRARGLREIRLWVPDIENSDVLARLTRDGQSLRGAPEQAEADEFFTAHFDEIAAD